MNYQKIYDSIILKAKNENRNKRNSYYEKHHIFPKCLGGNNDKTNLVLLTAREHFICHKLLMRIYKGNSKLAFAYCMLAFDKNNKRKISAREYLYAKEIRKIPVSKETKLKISTTSIKRGSQRKQNNPMWQKSPWNKGICYTNEYKEKLRIPNTKEQNKNVSIAMQLMLNIQCPHCKKIMTNSNGAYTRYHGDKCKLNLANINTI